MTKTPDYEGLCEKLTATALAGRYDRSQDDIDLVLNEAAQAIRTLMGEKAGLVALFCEASAKMDCGPNTSAVLARALTRGVEIMDSSLPNAARPSVPGGDEAGRAANPWGPGGSKVKEAVKKLTRREREIVGEGYINGEAKAQTVRSLQHKGMFYLRITSPNGQCGFMELTPLGLNARAMIVAKATTANAVGTQRSEVSKDHPPAQMGEGDA